MSNIPETGSGWICVRDIEPITVRELVFRFNLIPTSKARSLLNLEPDQRACQVCLEDFKPEDRGAAPSQDRLTLQSKECLGQIKPLDGQPEIAMMLPCSHVFCERCCVEWFMRHGGCPHPWCNSKFMIETGIARCVVDLARQDQRLDLLEQRSREQDRRSDSLLNAAQELARTENLLEQQIMEQQRRSDSLLNAVEAFKRRRLDRRDASLKDAGS